MKKTMLDINNDVKLFKDEFSIEHILLSIRKLRDQVNKLINQRVHDLPVADDN